MKKATNPLPLDLRTGGFEIFPIAKLFDLPSNVWYPSVLIRENMLAKPFAAWAANVFYTLGGGITAEFIAGIAGIVLGGLALVGIVPMTLLSVGVITYSATLLT